MDTLYDGSPNWTERGAEGGLDPLGMLAPIETVYTGMLQGLSSVTTRLRYYPFYCWWVMKFFDRESDGKVSDFRRHIREGEALFAAVSIHHAEKEGWINGLAGSIRVGEVLRRQGTVNLEELSQSYLKVPAYYAAYRSQMVDMGLMREKKGQSEHPPSALGLQLGSAFAGQVGEVTAKRFFDCTEKGFFTADDLALLRPFRCAYADPEADDPELVIIRKCLAGREGNGYRRNTCLQILQTIESNPAIRSDYDLRFVWLETEPDPSSPLFEEQRKWRHYQLADSIRVGMECLLSYATEYLKKDAVPASQLASATVSNVPLDVDLQTFLISLADTDQHCRQIQEAAISHRKNDISIIIRLLAHIWFHYRHLVDEMISIFPPREAFRSSHSELLFIEGLLHLPAREAMASFMLKRVIRRHIDVASRKLRSQGNFTFQFEWEDGVLAPRHHGQVGPSSPRTGTMISFMHEVGLLSDYVITPTGYQELLEQT